MVDIPYWQQRQQLKLKGTTSLKEVGKTGITPDNNPRAQKAQKKQGKQCKSLKDNLNTPMPKKKKKPIKKRTKKMAKKMRQLAQINKELLGDKTRDLTEPCLIQSPVCTYYATVINHNAGREGDQLLNKDDMTPCCPPCNDYIEKHPKWAEERGFKKRRHQKKSQNF